MKTSEEITKRIVELRTLATEDNIVFNEKSVLDFLHFMSLGAIPAAFDDGPYIFLPDEGFLRVMWRRPSDIARIHIEFMGDGGGKIRWQPFRPQV